MSLRLVLCLIAGCLLAAPAVADDWFTIELIVFEHREDASSGTEVFPRDPGRPDLLATMHLLPPTEPRTLRDFEQLEPASRQLSGVWRTLQRSSRYAPLLHAGWTQLARAPDRASPVAIDLFTGVPLPPVPLATQLPTESPVSDDDPDQSGLGPDMGTTPEQEPESAGNPYSSATDWQVVDRLRADYAAPTLPPRLYGTVRLHLQRYLHVEVDLLLTTNEPLPQLADEDDERDWYAARDDILRDLEYGLLDEADAVRLLDDLQVQPRYQAYRLRDSRLIRSGEVHYLDHPRFGMIVTVRPLPAEEQEARQQALDAATLEREATTTPSEPLQDFF